MRSGRWELGRGRWLELHPRPEECVAGGSRCVAHSSHRLGGSVAHGTDCLGGSRGDGATSPTGYTTDALPDRPEVDRVLLVHEGQVRPDGRRHSDHALVVPQGNVTTLQGTRHTLRDGGPHPPVTREPDIPPTARTAGHQDERHPCVLSVASNWTTPVRHLRLEPPVEGACLLLLRHGLSRVLDPQSHDS